MFTRVLPIILALCYRASGADIYFLNPPRFGAKGDFSSNPVYTIGQNLRVQWSEAPDNTGVSVLLYQLNDTYYMLPGQYLFQNVVNITLYDWTVAVSDNLPASLSESNLFYLSVFREGQTSSDSNSHYFNITEAKSTATSTLSSTTSSATTTLPTGTNIASSSIPDPTSTISTAPESTITTPSSGSNTDLSTGAKIGLGVGLPAAAIIGIGVGWFFFGRRRRQEHGPAGGSEKDARNSHPSSGPGHRSVSTGLPEYWGPSSYNGGSIYSEQAEPPRFQYSPPVFEASGESRATLPAELHTNPPKSR